MRPEFADVHTYASFEAAWQPDAYLSSYYSAVESDERATLQFLVEVAAQVGPISTLLEFGCGPTVHHLFPFAAQARTIHVADYLPANLLAVRRWTRADPDAHDWSAFAAAVLGYELGRPASRSEIAAREELTRQRITRFLDADARSSPPIADEAAVPGYRAVLCCFCTDSITDDLAEWRRCTRNITELVVPGGWFVLAALRAAAAYRVGDARFPSARVTERDVADVLADAGFEPSQTTVTVATTPDVHDFGFGSIVLAAGRRAWS
jgi:hypothetical protein